MINVLKFSLPGSDYVFTRQPKHLAIGFDGNVMGVLRIIFYDMTEEQLHCALQFDPLKVTDTGDNNTPTYASGLQLVGLNSD